MFAAFITEGVKRGKKTLCKKKKAEFLALIETHVQNAVGNSNSR